MKFTSFTIIMLSLLVLMVGPAYGLPVTINKVEINDIELQPNEQNRLDIVRGQPFEVEVQITPQEDLDDVAIYAYISGFEFLDAEPSAAVTPLFDADANVRYPKRLVLHLSDEFEEDDYKLRIQIVDRNGEALVQNYNLKIDVPRHFLKIEDIVLNPQTSVKGGSAILVTVRVENGGEQDEEDIKVTVSVPELKISAVEYINEIEQEDEEETEEVFLRVPRCTKAGTYPLMVEVAYNEGHLVVQDQKTIQVVEDETCEEEKQTAITAQLSSSFEKGTQGAAGTATLFVTNPGKTKKTVTVNAQQKEGPTAPMTITPSNTMILQPGTTQTFTLSYTVPEDTAAGAAHYNIVVTSGKDSTQIPFTLSISPLQKNQTRATLEVLFIVLGILLVIVGAIAVLYKFREEEEEPQAPRPSQLYY